MLKNMIKISIYILLITTLSACSSFKGTDESVEISRKGEITRKDDKALTAEEIYNTAKGALKREQYDIAIESYRKIEANHPFSNYAEQSHIELAFAMYKLKRWDGAVAVIDRFISMNNTSKLIPYAYYLRGLTNFNRGKTFFNFLLPHVQVDKDPVNIRNSYEDFNHVYKKYKSSRYAKDALKRMVYLRNTLASYELHVANYYYKRKAYVAVINRCNFLIENYPNAPATIDSLFFLRKSYEMLLMKDSARLIDKVIEKNYPEYQSVYFNEILDNKISRNLVAISEVADDIAISMGFDIEDQSPDNFDGVYNVEYFTNEKLVEIPRVIKPERYSIIYKINNEKISVKNSDEQMNILNYFFKEDKRDLYVKDIIVNSKINNKNKETLNTQNISDKTKDIQIIDSEDEIINLIG